MFGGQHGIHADVGEARQGVDLVEDQLARIAIEEKVHAGQGTAVEHAEDGFCRFADAFFKVGGNVGANACNRGRVVVFGIEIVEFIGGNDLTHLGGKRFSVVNDRAFQLAGVDKFLNQHARIVFKRNKDAAAKRFLVGCLGDADGGTRRAGLDEHGKAQLAHALAHDTVKVACVIAVDGDIACLLDADAVHKPLGQRFVHGVGRGRHAASHIGNVQHFKQTLDGSVLAVFSVENREEQIGFYVAADTVFHRKKSTVLAARGEKDLGAVRRMLPLVGGDERRVATIEQPRAVLGDADEGNIVCFTVDIVDDSFCRFAGDGVFGGLAAEEQSDFLFHGCMLLSVDFTARCFFHYMPMRADGGYSIQHYYNTPPYVRQSPEVAFLKKEADSLRKIIVKRGKDICKL